MSATESGVDIHLAWVCRDCEVGGTDIECPGSVVTCWNCQGPVLVTARMPKPKPRSEP